MKKFKYLFLIFLLILLFPLNCFASVKTYTRTKDNLRIPGDVVVDDNNRNIILKTPSINSSEKIYDFAEVLTSDEEMVVYNSIKDYIKESGFDISIVITRDLNGLSVSDYTYAFYDYNDFKDDGISFLIYLNEENPEIFMGVYGNDSNEVSSIYYDKRINQILEYIYKNYIIDNNYYGACTKYVEIIQKFYENAHGDYKVDDEGEVVKAIPWIEIIIISLAGTFIIMMLLLRKNKNIKIIAYDFIKKSVNYNTMIVKCESDQIIKK